MKSINIKKVAAVAAGTAMLVGAAFAAVSGLTSGFVIDSNGNPNVQIVVGGNALASDGIAAGNLAAVIGSKAYVSTGGEQTVTPDASGSATINVAGGQVTLPESSVRTDITWAQTLGGAVTGGLTLSSAQGLSQGTLTYRATDYDYEEEISAASATSTITIAYAEGTDYHGISFASVKPNKIYYKFQFVDTFPIPGGALAQTVTIPFLGENYVLNKLKSTEAELVKGEEKTLGIGQSVDITMGDTTYTVKLDDARLNEVTTTGQATLTVTTGGTSTTLSLDTANEQSKSVGDFMVFLQSVAKSYTPGQGGSATVRLGGDVLLLKDGQNPTQYPDWKARIVTSATNSSNLDRLDLVYDKTVQAKDQITEIAGPGDYFALQFVGDEVARGVWESEDITVSATGSSDAALDEITYEDFGYEKTYTVPLNDDVQQLAFLAANRTGFIGVIGGNQTSTQRERLLVNGTLVNATDMMPLYEDDIFFVYNTPVRITSITTSSALANAQVQFTVGYGGSGSTSKTVQANDARCTQGNTADGYFVRCASVPIVGSNAVTFYFPWNSTNYTGTYNLITVAVGADNDVDTRYGVIHWANGTNVTRNQAGGQKEMFDGYQPVAGNGVITTGIGPRAVNVTDTAGVYHEVNYTNSTTNPGILVQLAGNVNEINQATTNSDYDSNRFQYTAGAWIEATSTESVTFSNPEVATGRTKRVALIRGAATATSASEKTVTTADTFPVDVSSGVTVTEMTCTADEVKYTTGVTFGTVGTLVIDDNSVPSGNAIVIGGHLVNKLAVGVTEAKLTKAGDKVEEMVGTNVYVAGYTAADTLAAVNDLIAQIKAM